MLCEALEQDAYERGLHIVPMDFIDDIDAMIIGRVVYIEKSDIPHKYNRILAHEIAHSITLPFDLFNAPTTTQDKYEALATAETIRRLVPIARIIELYNRHWYNSAEEYAEELEVDAEFWERALEYYHNYYGYKYRYEKYLINFSPLQVEECSDKLNK